jgi:hypothetical protein
LLRTTVSIHTVSIGGHPSLHPLLGHTLQLRRTWRQPKAKREPFTYDMMAKLHSLVSRANAKDLRHVLSLEAAIFDWTRLGTFTGSRVSEYGQTKSARGTFSKVPHSKAAGIWAGSPIAFMRCDFTLLDKHLTILSFEQMLKNPERAIHLHIRFRFDKSPQNFTVRKFRRSGHSFLCPILAAISILLRAHALGVPESSPIGVFRPIASTPSFTFITSSDVIRIMRQTCLLTYPDKEHFLNKNVDRIVAHSVRVTAAVALFNMKYSIDEIAYRLRWQPQSVQHYLRECTTLADDRTQSAMAGACAI